MLNRPARIAVVDDDASVRKALGRLLEASAFEAESFGSARELLDSLGHRRPDCIVVDLQMPHMNRLELQAHLARAGIEIPTVIITAQTDARARERCEAAGARGYLVKPLRDTSLVAAINAAMAPG